MQVNLVLASQVQVVVQGLANQVSGRPGQPEKGAGQPDFEVWLLGGQPRFTVFLMCF